MIRFRRGMLVLLAGVCLRAASPAAAAGSFDDPFYRWDLERYRIERLPDAPSGGILPLPDFGRRLRAPEIRAAALSLDLARAARTIPLEEGDGSHVRDGIGMRYGVDGRLPFLLNGQIGLAARIVVREGESPAGSLLERNLVWRTRKVELLLGMTRSFWGDGSEGSLLLGRTAPPLDMVRIRSLRPWVVPSTRSIARFHGSFFLAYLDDRFRTVPYPLLQGSRLEWEPSPFVRLAATRTIMMGGAGRTDRLKAADLWNIWWARNENARGPRDYRDTDQKASFSFELRLPSREWTPVWFEGARFFYEYAGEDAFHGLLPTAVAHLTGGTLAVSGWLALAEFSETVDDANWWYTNHTVYGPDAYYYRGYVLGHPMGPNGISGHVRIWSPEIARGRGQLWLRARGHYDHESRRTQWWDESAGIKLRTPWGARKLIEAGLETYREAKAVGAHPKQPISWKASLSVALAGSSPGDALTEPAPGW